MSMRRRLVVTIPLLALCGGDAFAGVVVTTTGTNFGTNSPSQVIVYAEADKLKIVTESLIVIYRGDLQKYWTISSTLKTYSELTPELLKQLAERRTAAQAAMQQQIAKMTPQQQKEFQAKMSKLGVPQAGASAAQANRVTYTKAGAPPKTVANLPCELYRKTTSGSGERTEDVCVAHIGAAGLTAADFKAMDSINTFMEPLLGGFTNWITVDRAIGFDGLILDSILYLNGAQVRRDTVQKIERTDIPASTFDLPTGFAFRPSGPRPRP